LDLLRDFEWARLRDVVRLSDHAREAALADERRSAGDKPRAARAGMARLTSTASALHAAARARSPRGW